jgi:hypothetical protein
VYLNRPHSHGPVPILPVGIVCVYRTITALGIELSGA